MKKSFRQSALAYRNLLASEEIMAFSQEISASLITLLQTLQPCTVGLFYPVRGEPNLLDIMNHPALGGFVWALPVCCESPTGATLKFARFDTGIELEAGLYSIPVPKIKDWTQPDVLVIPCLAFHRTGARLGYGAGWYDRALCQFDTVPITVGVAYSRTELSENFSEEHDQLLDYVITERETLIANSL